MVIGDTRNTGADRCSVDSGGSVGITPVSVITRSMLAIISPVSISSLFLSLFTLSFLFPSSVVRDARRSEKQDA